MQVTLRVAKITDCPDAIRYPRKFGGWLQYSREVLYTLLTFAAPQRWFEFPAHGSVAAELGP